MIYFVGLVLVQNLVRTSYPMISYFMFSLGQGVGSLTNTNPRQKENPTDCRAPGYPLRHQHCGPSFMSRRLSRGSNPRQNGPCKSEDGLTIACATKAPINEVVIATIMLNLVSSAASEQPERLPERCQGTAGVVF
ncbi:hypothetical protein PoB_004996500 [Plakobranchus ocellatus]|uniref:Uncharacterized protein n=1 Tax=Plakobranchus ocellatus TaxID=259542 RepID=A0AAV4BWH9_9GAST|nr:hypothetical protein PoB_004996500 [Plakobranchus ocellatus]